MQFGALTRTVRDTAALLDVLAGPMPGDPYAAPHHDGPSSPRSLALRDVCASRLRPARFRQGDRPNLRRSRDDTVKLLRDLGHDVEEAFPTFDRDALVQTYLVQVGVGTATEIDDMARWVGREPRAVDFEPATWFLRQVGLAMGGVDLQRARDAMQVAGRSLAEFHGRYDVLVSPTLAHPPCAWASWAKNRPTAPL